MTRERLLDTPDDQLIFFWTESAHFTIRGPVERNVLNYIAEYTLQLFEVLDADGHIVGYTGACREAAGVEVHHTVKFLLLANNRPVEFPPQKIILQIVRRAGIAYRVNIAQVGEEAWEKANPCRVLAALG